MFIFSSKWQNAGANNNLNFVMSEKITIFAKKMKRCE